LGDERKDYLGDVGGDADAGFANTIIIPAYNEEHRIGPTLSEYLNHLSQNTEVMVVLNGCKDRTADVVSSFLDKGSHLRIIDEPGVVGKGGAITAGFRRARGDVIAYVDADGATSAEEIERLMSLVDGEDGVLGSRWIDKNYLRRKQSILRRITSRVFNTVVKILFRLPYKDTQCGAKVFKREAVDKIVDMLGTTNLAFDVDVLYLMKKHGLALKEVPTVWEDKDGSSVRMWRTAPRMFGAVVRMRIKHSRLKNLVN